MLIDISYLRLDNKDGKETKKDCGNFQFFSSAIFEKVKEVFWYILVDCLSKNLIGSMFMVMII